MSESNYDPDDPQGWVVQWTHDVPLKDGGTRESVTYWRGPDSGFGTTYGSLWLRRERWPHFLESAVFPTKAKAVAAVRSVYGVMSRRHKAVRLADAIDAEDARLAQLASR